MSDLEKKAEASEALSLSATGQVALDHAIAAVDLYMRAASQTDQKTHAVRLRRKCKDLISRAEVLKRDLSAPKESRNASIIQAASRLHGNDFPPWDAEPPSSEFRLTQGAKVYIDDATFSMSIAQEAILDAWKHPEDMFGLDSASDVESFMDSTQGCDLVQDVTTDCSVVASLSAALRVLTGKRAVLSSVIRPFDKSKGLPRFSSTGKYVLRMHFNGCTRRVVIDDRLPASRTERTLFVVDRQNPRLIWPALIEKAYLKVRGGYDFPGSNSGTDLWVITGWIPEQVFLQKEDLDVHSMWRSIKEAHDNDNVVITLGTGRISHEEEEATGLIGEHDYAVLGLEEANGVRQLHLKNPWCNGPPWAGSARRNSSTGANTADHASVMDLDDVVQNFECMYLNWNPDLLPCRQDWHFAWRTPDEVLSSSLLRNPQYSVTSTTGGPVWILVSKHFTDAELDIAREVGNADATRAKQLGYVGLLVFDNGGSRVQLNDGEFVRSPYVDSPQTLARIDACAQTSYTVVFDQHELPLPSYTFTISFLSQSPLLVEEAREAMAHHIEESGAWRRRTAGGSVASPSFHINPQYKLEVTTATALSIFISTGSHELRVHLDLIWSNGERAYEVKLKDLVGSSGEYRRGCAMAAIPSIDPGAYTLVCSTFEPGQLANFIVRVDSTVPVTLKTIPADGAGRLRTPLAPITFSEGEQRKRARIAISCHTRANIALHCAVDQGTEHGVRTFSGPMLRLFIALGWGSQQQIIAEAADGEFQEVTDVLRTPHFDMEPELVQRRGLWVVLECVGHHTIETPRLDGEVFSTAPIQLGDWESL